MLNYLILKSFLPYVYILFIPYKYQELLLVSFICLILRKNKKIYFYVILKNIKKDAIFYLYTFINLFYFDNTYYKMNQIVKESILIPYFTKYNRRKLTFTIIIFFIKFKVPKYIIRVIFLNTINLIITNNLGLFTNNEILLSNLYVSLQHNSKIQNKRFIKLMVNLLTSYRITEIILNTFQNLYTGLKLKQKLSLQYNFIYIKYFLGKILNYIIKDTYVLIIIIWNRFQ